MKTNNPVSYEFNNGPGLFVQLKQQKIINYLERISKLEEHSQFQVLKFWNRRWEYPFILEVNNMIDLSGEVLDAGAGQSLMPFLLMNKKNNITAIDTDDGSFYPTGSIEKWYQKMNELFNSNVIFVNGNLTTMNFQNGHFDFVYSLSVLEHLSDPLTGLKELWRILKPGGYIAITIDVSLDDTRGMFKKDYYEIKTFLKENGIPLFPESLESTGDMITTNWFKENEPEALPWRIQRKSMKKIIKELFSGRWNFSIQTERYFASLLVVGLAYRKPNPILSFK
jgi:ubiquinone/menaquinone biosynthesis C-methylase UbiE